MKASNKKRLEKLERIRSPLSESSVIIFDPKAPRLHDFSSHKGVKIFLPSNGRELLGRLSQTQSFDSRTKSSLECS